MSAASSITSSAPFAFNPFSIEPLEPQTRFPYAIKILEKQLDHLNIMKTLFEKLVPLFENNQAQQDLSERISLAKYIEQLATSLLEEKNQENTFSKHLSKCSRIIEISNSFNRSETQFSDIVAKIKRLDLFEDYVFLYEVCCPLDSRVDNVEKCRAAINSIEANICSIAQGISELRSRKEITLTSSQEQGAVADEEGISRLPVSSPREPAGGASQTSGTEARMPLLSPLMSPQFSDQGPLNFDGYPPFMELDK